MKKFKNFKVVGLFLSLLLVAILVIGCEEDPAFEPKFIINTISSGVGGTINPLGRTKVSPGDALTVSIMVEKGYEISFVKVDGNVIPVPTNLSYTFKSIDADHKFEVGFNKFISKSLQLLTKKEWKEIRWQRRNITAPETEWDIDKGVSELGDQRITFDAQTFKYKETYNGMSWGAGFYELKTDSLIIGGGIRSKILTLSEDTLRIQFISEYYIVPNVHDHTKDKYVQVTYIH